MRAASRRGAAAARPSAHSTPEARGTRIRRIPSSRASAAACSGPAPPNGISAKPRGSIPRSTVIARSAPVIAASATRTIPSAQRSVAGVGECGGSARGRRIDSARTGGIDFLGETQRGGEGGDRALGGVAVELQAAGEWGVRRQAPEQQVGVGHRRVLAAAPVARRPGVGARRVRAHPQRAARVAPRDRAAAGAHGVDVEHRQRQRPARHDALGGLRHAAACDQAHVAGGAAHVEAHHVALTRQLAPASARRALRRRGRRAPSAPRARRPPPRR